ncbi:MAG: DNA integrity scanning protein DisA with diadenylate cyclase activity [Francisellaceae bacterium]|jgi:DNA integrity scanning protein DisA with diadenylate cyclase activity
MINNFKDILLKIDKESDDDFSGVGTVLYSDINEIPIYPLNINNIEAEVDKLIPTLIKISKISSPFHDGFHFISSNFKLTHASQYFSPPIICGIEIGTARVAVGGRYMAALFGSCMRNILLTGIVTKSNGVVIFKDGMEVYSKERK